MWRGLTSITTLLNALLAAMQEQNALMRELLAAQGRPSRVPLSGAGSPPPSSQRQRRQFTDKDVIQVTREMTQQMAWEAARQALPHQENWPPALAQFPGEPPPPEAFFDSPLTPISPPPLNHADAARADPTNAAATRTAKAASPGSASGVG